MLGTPLLTPHVTTLLSLRAGGERQLAQISGRVARRFDFPVAAAFNQQAQHALGATIIPRTRPELVQRSLLPPRTRNIPPWKLIDISVSLQSPFLTPAPEGKLSPPHYRQHILSAGHHLMDATPQKQAETPVLSCAPHFASLFLQRHFSAIRA